MANKDYKKYKATVTKKYPKREYGVIRDGEDEERRCILNGKMKKHRINLMIGDEVTVEEIPNSRVDRITYRN